MITTPIKFNADRFHVAMLIVFVKSQEISFNSGCSVLFCLLETNYTNIWNNKS